MSRALKCDICGCFYEPYNQYSSANGPNSIRYFREDDNGDRYIHGGYMDCCPECMDAIVEFVNSRKPVKEREKDGTEFGNDRA